MELSIIIPFYNALPYFNELLDSLMPQITDDIEVIFVDDASTDESLSAIDKYLSNYNVYLIKNDSNKGVSYSRNEAIKKARGEYIWFVDADDIIPVNTVNIIINHILSLKSKVDIVYANFGVFYNSKGIEELEHTNFPLKSFEPKEYFFEDKIKTFYKDLSNCSMVFNCLYNKELLMNNNILFNEKIRAAETVIFKINCFWHAESFSFINDSIYYYRRFDDGTKSLSMNMPGLESIKESIVMYAEIFLKFENNYQIGEGRDYMMLYASYDFLVFSVMYYVLSGKSDIQMLLDEKIVDNSVYDKILKYRNQTLENLINGGIKNMHQFSLW